MTEEQNYEDLDVSDIVDDSEHYPDSDHHVETQNTETTDTEKQNRTEKPTSDNSVNEEPAAEKKPHRSEVTRSTRLPMARIKNIMKMDPDVSVISSDALYLVTRGAELFVEAIAQETYTYTSKNKRKVITKKDLDLVINKVDCLCFLEGAMDF